MGVGRGRETQRWQADTAGQEALTWGQWDHLPTHPHRCLPREEASTRGSFLPIASGSCWTAPGFFPDVYPWMLCVAPGATVWGAESQPLRRSEPVVGRGHISLPLILPQLLHWESCHTQPSSTGRLDIPVCSSTFYCALAHSSTFQYNLCFSTFQTVPEHAIAPAAH